MPADRPPERKAPLDAAKQSKGQESQSWFDIIVGILEIQALTRVC